MKKYFSTQQKKCIIVKPTQHWFMKKFYILLIVLITLGFVSRAKGDMTSSNYEIYSDSIGVNGGNFSSSTTNSLSDTLGETSAATVSSTSYTIEGGFQAMSRGSLSVSVSNNGSVDLGTLSPSAVNTASVTVAVSTDSDTGYSLSITSAGSMPLASIVPPNTVTTGTEGYGFSASGIDSAFSGEQAVGPILVASASSPVTGDNTTLTFKAALGSGDYNASTFSQSIVLTASANI